MNTYNIKDMNKFFYKHKNTVNRNNNDNGTITFVFYR